MYVFRFISITRLASAEEMAGTDMTDFLRLIEEQLQPQNVADLQYVLKHSFTGKFLEFQSCFLLYID